MNMNPLSRLTTETNSHRLTGAFCAALLVCGLVAQAVPPPSGIAPVTVPAGGFSIGGEVVAGPAGDWMAGPSHPGVLNSAGVPLNPGTTFHFLDPYNSGNDNVFSSAGHNKWTDDPSTWVWTKGSVNAKSDINNVLIHVATDTNLHTWLIIAGDRMQGGSDSYIDFEFLQNTLVANTNGTFTSAGPNGGRTANDLLLSLAFSNGGTTADFLAWRWQTNSSNGGFAYSNATTSLPAGKVFVAVNSNSAAVPFGAFGSTNYSPMTFAEAAIDMTALMGDFDPCLSIGVKTIMVKTKSSTSSSASLADFVTPIQYSLRVGPSSYAGPAQTQCIQGASTAFALQGQATPGILPISSTTWSVVAGSATIDNPAALDTTAHVSSSSATLRLTVVQANGCTETSDVVLTVAPLPSCSIAGATTVCPLSSAQFFAPAGMAGYDWSVRGNGAITGPANGPMVTVTAGAACGASYTIALTTTTTNGCSSGCSSDVMVLDTVPPTIAAPASVTLECPADTTPNNTGVAVAHDNCGIAALTYNDVVANNCGGTEVITRTWTATDLCGNQASAAQIIMVRDTTPPTITAPANLELGFMADTRTNATGVAIAQDGCSSVTLSYSDSIKINANGTNVITRTWVATDACGNSASAVQTITLDAPTALVLPTQSDIVLTDLVTLTVTDTATNPNGTTNALIYQLINAPAGASIDNNGVITWTPTLAQSPSTNLFTVVVTTMITTSTGTVMLTGTNSFNVSVSTPYDGLDLSVDTDGDGLTNLVEFAVGSDPKNSGDGNSDIIIWITNDSGNRYLAMQFKRRVNAAALQLEYLPQVSADKANWASDNASVLELGVTPFDSEYDWVTVRDMTPITSAEARFIRLDIISTTLESASPVWIGSATPLLGNTGSGTKFTTFSQRMVLPVLYAGTVSSLQNTALTDANAAWSNTQFGSTNNPTYAEFDNGYMVDIAGTASSQSLSLAGSISGLVSPGDNYRVRQHFTVASLFGTNNETGLKAGLNPTQADTILLVIPETQQTMTIFYFSNAVSQGWYRADYSPAGDQVVYPEQGVMVRRIVPGDVNLYVCGPIKTGVTVVPVAPGFNQMGTLKSLSSMTLNTLNLYSGNPTTGLASGLNLTVSDNLLVVRPDGSTASYFYFKNNIGQEGWLDSLFNPAGNTSIPAGSAFFVKRQPANGSFNWTIPAE